jgi:hypothetical protein
MTIQDERRAAGKIAKPSAANRSFATGSPFLPMQKRRGILVIHLVKYLYTVLETRREHYYNLFRNLKPGVTEVIVHLIEKSAKHHPFPRLEDACFVLPGTFCTRYHRCEV